MSIQLIQDDNQFWFPEEVWELIKEFMITHRAKLLFNMKLLSIPRLSGIFEKYFQRRIKNMNDSRIPLEQRKNQIKSGIIKRCEKTPTRYAEIMEKEFQVKPKPVKNYDWVKEFAVGEELIVVYFNSKKSLGITKDRKGIIRKIGKTLQVDLYDYDRIDCGASTTQTSGFDRLRWLETINGTINVYNSWSVHKRGCYGGYWDNLFEEGKVWVDYRN